jgi:hypothetical protein
MMRGQLDFPVFGLTRTEGFPLRALKATTEWFDAVRGNTAHHLSLSDETLDAEIAPFLRSVQEERANEVYGLLMNKLGSSDLWHISIRWCLNSYNGWMSEEAARCLLYLCEHDSAPRHSLVPALRGLSGRNSKLGCSALEIMLRRLTGDWREAERPAEEARHKVRRGRSHLPLLLDWAFQFLL